MFGQLGQLGKLGTLGANQCRRTSYRLDFVFTIETTGADEEFQIACSDVGTFDAIVDWGDGTSATITAYNDPNLAHTYATAGGHQIRIRGTFPSLNMSSLAAMAAKIKSVQQLGSVGWIALNSAFNGCTNLTSFSSGRCDTSNVTTMGAMFAYCTTLTSLDVSGWDTSNVTNMGYMFYNCSSLTSLDVSGWDTSNVTNMSSMFYGCNSLTSLDVSGWAIGNVTNLINFAADVTIPTALYDSILINWEAQAPNTGLTVDFGYSEYTAGGAAEVARTSLINTYGWTITDGGAI